MQVCNYSPPPPLVCPTPAASPLAHRHRPFIVDSRVMQVLVLRHKITCAMKLDYSEEGVRNVNLTRTSSSNCTQRRQDTGQDVWGWVWMQWMTVKSLVPCYDLHVPQHDAVSLFEPINQPMISSAPSTKTVFAYLD